jgi:hypothetical protein
MMAWIELETSPGALNKLRNEFLMCKLAAFQKWR